MGLLHHLKLIVFVLSALLTCQTVRGFTVERETRLRAQLLANYSRVVRPEATAIVSMELHVTSISSVDIRNQVFSITGWWSMSWSDNRLNWTSSDYSNIPVVQFLEDDIWTPVLVVSNSINDLSAIDEDTIPIRVAKGGTVLWNPPALLSVSCNMDVTYFPFDAQTCNVEVTSFGYTMQELNIETYRDGLSFRYYQPSGEWDIIQTSSQRDIYAEDGYRYAKIIYSIKLRRKPLYYGLNMILPVVVNSALTLFVFLLPPESGEKIGYCLTVLLAFMVILTLVATDLPTTATSTPLLEIYIAMVLVMGGMSVICSIVVLHIFFLPETKRVPHLVGRLCRGLMRICFISRVELVYDGKVSPASSETAVSASDVTANHPDGKSSNDTKMHRLTRRNTSLTPIDRERKPIPSTDVTWQTVASVIDGVCLRVYALFLLVSTVVIMVMLTA